LKLVKYFWHDKVFIIAFSLALLSLFFVSPRIDQLKAVNINVLVIMFSLMISVAGLTEANFFSKIAIFLTSKFFTIRYIGLVIVLATFFLGMLVTNDAVLLTLVPFTLFVMRQTKEERYALTIVILQTFAANMGSALTPMGDPQNIYLYQYYDLGFFEFMGATFPITLTAFFLIMATTYFLLPNTFIKPVMVDPILDKKKILVESLIFLFVILLILRIVNPFVTLGVSIFLSLIFYPHLFKKPDYPLLLTFVSFFIFTYNLSSWPILTDFMANVLNTPQSVYFTGLLSSQVLSNVPASVLLSTFTEKIYWRYLLQSVNVGAMGSLIASLASLITFKFVIKELPGQSKTYILTYSVLGIIYIILLTCVVFIANR